MCSSLFPPSLCLSFRCPCFPCPARLRLRELSTSCHTRRATSGVGTALPSCSPWGWPDEPGAAAENHLGLQRNGGQQTREGAHHGKLLKGEMLSRTSAFLAQGSSVCPPGVLPARHLAAEPHTTHTALRSGTSQTLRISWCSLSLSEQNSSLTKIKT